MELCSFPVVATAGRGKCLSPQNTLGISVVNSVAAKSNTIEVKNSLKLVGRSEHVDEKWGVNDGIVTQSQPPCVA